MSKILSAVTKNPIGLAVGVSLVLGLVYFLGRKTITDVAQGLGDLASGNNDMTKGTPYEGAGVIGTIGAATNIASGGVFEKIGGWLGGSIYDLTHWNDPNTPSLNGGQTAANDINGRPSSIR